MTNKIHMGVANEHPVRPLGSHFFIMTKYIWRRDARDLLHRLRLYKETTDKTA